MPKRLHRLAAWGSRLLGTTLLACLLILIFAFAADALNASWRAICVSTAIGLAAVWFTERLEREG